MNTAITSLNEDFLDIDKDLINENIKFNPKSDTYDDIVPLNKESSLISRRDFLKAAAVGISSISLILLDNKYAKANSLELTPQEQKTIIPLQPIESFNRNSFINYEPSPTLSQAQIIETNSIFKNIANFGDLTEEQIYLATFYASLNHSESSWPILPYEDLAPQTILMDLETWYAYQGGNHHNIEDPLNSMMPQNGFIFSALSGLNARTLNNYLIPKARQFAKTPYASTIFKKHLTVAMNAMNRHSIYQQNQLNDPKYFSQFNAQKIFDPVSDPQSVLNIQLQWISENPNARALQFYKGKATWYICGARNSTVDNDPLSKYDVQLSQVAQDLKNY